MIIPVIPINTDKQKIGEVIKSTVTFRKDSIDIEMSYYADEESSSLGMMVEVYNNLDTSIRREFISGYEKLYNQSVDAWRFTIFTMGSHFQLWFRTEEEIIDFKELVRKYLYENLQCTT